VTDIRSSQPIRLGDVVAGKYRVDRVLGEGGMGTVMAATHLHLEQRVALKFLLPSMAAKADIVQRFLREARAAVKIHSEHVARVLDVGTHEGSPYMVMEYLEGGDLAQILAARGALPAGEAVGYVLEACEAIAEAHALGIVHRDLKPANLYLAQRPGGKPAIKVLDFGISKAPAATVDDVLTKTSAVMGSPSYMSPEQLVSAASVDPRADVWALGVVLYEMLTCSLPFTAASMPELVGAILQRAPRPIEAVREGVPQGMRAIVDRCLQKDPAGRYANVAELARALLPFGPSRSEQSVERIEHVLGLVGSAPPGTAANQSPAAGGGASTFVPTTSQSQVAGARRLLLSGVAVTVVLGGIAGVTALSLRGSRHLVTEKDTGSGAATTIANAPSAGLVPSAPAAPSVPQDLTPLPVAPSSPSASSGPVRAAPAALAVPKASAHAAPSSGPPPPATALEPTCRTVSYFDTDGNKHFKQECK
jgi:eukaryotic-like serine/threonine-protein kinase